MKLDLEALKTKLNERYAERKLGSDVGFRAPEVRPRIQSDQVMALLEVLVEALNEDA